MEFYSTYLVRICRRDENTTSIVLGTVEEIGGNGRDHATFSNLKELQSLLSRKKTKTLWKTKSLRMEQKCPD